MAAPPVECQPEVAAGVLCGVSDVARVGDASVDSGDVVMDRPSVAPTPTVAVADPLPASSSESAFDVGAAVKVKRKKRRQHTFDDVVPALADDVTKLLEDQVGRFTHALCAPLSDVPAYFEPASASKTAP